eukprot:2532852-Rhodomonas_salina.1
MSRLTEAVLAAVAGRRTLQSGLPSRKSSRSRARILHHAPHVCWRWRSGRAIICSFFAVVGGCADVECVWVVDAGRDAAAGPDVQALLIILPST